MGYGTKLKKQAAFLFSDEIFIPLPQGGGISGAPDRKLLFTKPDNVKRIILRKKIRCYIINIFTIEANIL